MTFADIVNEVGERINLTSATALARIGRSVNERYRRLASSIGIKTIERRIATASTSIGNRSLTFGPTPIGVQKILSVYNNNQVPLVVLAEYSFDELRNASVGTDPASAYAIQLMGSSSVTIFLNCLPTSSYELSADVESNITTLAGTDVPAFAEDFHDILILGAMATEYDKLDKAALSDKKEKQYDVRLSELRMHIANSAYLEIYQGKAGAAPGSGSGSGGTTGTTTGFTPGSVLFTSADGATTQDNAHFYWDDAGNRLKIGSGATVGGMTSGIIATAQIQSMLTTASVVNSVHMYIGTDATGSFLNKNINGLEVYTVNSPSATSTQIGSISGTTEHNGTGTITKAIGTSGNVLIRSSGGGTTAIGVNATMTGRVGSGTGTFTTGYGLYVGTFGSGFTSTYGIYVADPNASNWLEGYLVVQKQASFNADVLVGGILIIAGQIYFPSTAVPSTNPNILDDYEEGTFTPTDASGAGLTLSTATGFYTKIGRQVHVNIQVVYPATANASAMAIGGLPFTCNAINTAVTIGYSGALTGLLAYIPASTTTLVIHAAGTIRTNVQITAGNFVLSATYFV